jgi:AcrR family transcriptional regulator
LRVCHRAPNLGALLYPKGMRALPGRASRTSLAETAAVTRGSLQSAQRQRILRATGELVAKRGYNDVTVERIVRRAQVSFKTFYRHFPNKEECFLELFDTAFEHAERGVCKALAAKRGAPWPQQVAVALRTIVEIIGSDPIIARACIVEGPTVGPVMLGRYVKASKAFSPLFQGGREFSPHGDLLPETLEETLAGSVLWSVYQRLIVGEVDRIEKFLPEAIELVLRPYIGEVEAAGWSRWPEDETSAPASVTP